MRKRNVRLTTVKNTLSAKVLQNECQNPPKENIHQKKTLSRLTKTKITSTNN